MASGAKIAAGAEVGYAQGMLIRLAVLAMLFAASAVAQQQEKSMMERIFNPDMELKNSFEGKSFEGKSFASREFRGADGYAGVKSAQTKEFATRKFLGIRNPWFGKEVYETDAARDLRRYALADRGYSTRPLETKSSRDAVKQAPASGKTEADATRSFLGRGKSQDSLNASNPSGGALSMEEVREILNRSR
jgi:hypothetical protein